MTQSVLQRAGMVSVYCHDLDEVCDHLESGAGAALIAEEFVSEDPADRLVNWLTRQPPWSDMPIVMLARRGADSDALVRAMDLFGNVTVLERPTRVAALISVIRMALRARLRQYQIREHLAERAAHEAVLRDADQRKDEFLAMLAHELRNPLAPIRNCVDILRVRNQDDPTFEHVGMLMARQVDYMVRLVDDLLDVSRITRGKIDLRTESIDLRAVARAAHETAAPMVDSEGHELIVDLPTEPIPVNGDPVRLEQVLANLLNNAAKYTDRGGRIWLTVRSDRPWAVISVRDSGRGIPIEVLPRVFDLFMQMVRDADRSKGGLGIGLTVAKRLVEMHGGTIEAHSQGPGTGSEFLIRLPLVAEHVSRAPPPVAAPARVFGRRVLVVDDNRDAAESLGLLLRLFGAVTEVSGSGPDALDKFSRDRPSLVLLDIGMPTMDGYEVARRIRQHPQSRDVTLVAVSGWGQPEDRRKSAQAGFDYHLTKPVDAGVLEALFSALDKDLNRAPAERPSATFPRENG